MQTELGDCEALIKLVHDDPAALSHIAGGLADHAADALVDALKLEADRHYWINANYSLELADLLVQTGRLRGNPRHQALGMMTRGDALKFLGQIAPAWEALGEAGDLFLRAGDEIGWARTRIGRLFICVDLDRVAEALADAEQARAIFTMHGVYEKLLVLDLNTATVYNLLGDQRQALALYQAALATNESLLASGQGNQETLLTNMAMLSTNIGNVYNLLGDFRQALAYHERARDLFAERQQPRGAALAEYNSAHILMHQGHYRRALQLLHRAHDLYIAAQLTHDATNVSRDIVECYLLLNRYGEARDLAKQAVAAYHTSNVGFQEAYTLLHLATAEAELGNFEAAQAALDQAEPIFAALGARTWGATTRLRRARIALNQGHPEAAMHEASAAASVFGQDSQRVNLATAMLVSGQAQFALNDLDGAAEAGTAALDTARSCNVPPLRYAAHLLLGRIATSRGRLTRAERCFKAAVATVERVQRSLTITLRPGFLEDKGEALRALMALQIDRQRVSEAFATLERAKSQALLSYLAHREQFHWASGDPRSQALIERLNQLREEHQWFYRVVHEHNHAEPRAHPVIGPDQALAEVAARERQMRAITEQLYLHRESGTHQVAVPSLSEIQQSLDDDTLLVEFYNDGERVWAFTLDRDTVEMTLLPTTIVAVDHLLGQLQINIGAALSVGSSAPTSGPLTTAARRILGRLHAALLAPLAERTHGQRRLVVVPYGALHYLPFHLLHTGEHYLIERHEVVVLPAAALAARRGPRRRRGALVLAHSWENRLPGTQAEAQAVLKVFGGDMHCEQAARRAVFEAPPTQLLHIAAHGEHRLDRPELSYIQLADGQVYTDDLLQHDLSYELVALSACETGRAKVAAGDELIGLGRGFLYAGAGALLSSLWRVADDHTIPLMVSIYATLAAGASKAAAVRQAQLQALDQAPQLHPAFWGAFQLVGDAGPLSNGKE